MLSSPTSLCTQTDPHMRTKLFNVYNLVGYLATAFGQVAAGEVLCIALRDVCRAHLI